MDKSLVDLCALSPLVLGMLLASTCSLSKPDEPQAGESLAALADVRKRLAAN
jgi:hypothetical protein